MELITKVAEDFAEFLNDTTADNGLSFLHKKSSRFDSVLEVWLTL